MFVILFSLFLFFVFFDWFFSKEYLTTQAGWFIVTIMIWAIILFSVSVTRFSLLSVLILSFLSAFLRVSIYNFEKDNSRPVFFVTFLSLFVPFSFLGMTIISPSSGIEPSLTQLSTFLAGLFWLPPVYHLSQIIAIFLLSKKLAVLIPKPSRK